MRKYGDPCDSSEILTVNDTVNYGCVLPGYIDVITCNKEHESQNQCSNLNKITDHMLYIL